MICPLFFVGWSKYLVSNKIMFLQRENKGERLVPRKDKNCVMQLSVTLKVNLVVFPSLCYATLLFLIKMLQSYMKYYTGFFILNVSTSYIIVMPLIPLYLLINDYVVYPSTAVTLQDSNQLYRQ